CAVARAEPHSEQNLNADGFLVPHRGQAGVSAAPQAPQNLAPAEFSNRHPGQSCGAHGPAMQAHRPTRSEALSRSGGGPDDVVLRPHAPIRMLLKLTKAGSSWRARYCSISWAVKSPAPTRRSASWVHDTR